MGAYVTEVITGEAVVLDVPIARFPSRALALGIDVAVQLVALTALSGVAIAAGLDSGLDPAAVAALGLCVFVLVIVGYPVTFETLSRGRTLGKLALGLCVVSDDGGPERFRQALMRALAGVIEIWLTGGFLALVTSLLSRSGKRLGDIFGGTLVITVRLPRHPAATAPLSALPPVLAGWAATLELSGLSDATAETARQYLTRYYELTPAARAEFGQRIAAAVASQVSPAPPPGTTPPDYLSAVLAQRRGRDQARLSTQSPGPAQRYSAAPGPPDSQRPPAAVPAPPGRPAVASPPGSTALAPVPAGPATRGHLVTPGLAASSAAAAAPAPAVPAPAAPPAPWATPSAPVQATVPLDPASPAAPAGPVARDAPAAPTDPITPADSPRPADPPAPVDPHPAPGGFRPPR
jgi:uncharacterized RDD family membrane protein YckC